MRIIILFLFLSVCTHSQGDEAASRYLLKDAYYHTACMYDEIMRDKEVSEKSKAFYREKMVGWAFVYWAVTRMPDHPADPVLVVDNLLKGRLQAEILKLSEDPLGILKYFDDKDTLSSPFSYPVLAHLNSKKGYLQYTREFREFVMQPMEPKPRP